MLSISEAFLNVSLRKDLGRNGGRDGEMGDRASEPGKVEGWSRQEKGGIKGSYIMKWLAGS